MEARLEYARRSPEGYRAFLALNKFVNECGLEHSLLELIKVRASQLNEAAAKGAGGIAEAEPRARLGFPRSTPLTVRPPRAHPPRNRP